MSTSESQPRQFDHHSREHAADPVGAFRSIREGKGIVRSDLYGGFSVVTRYDDVVALAKDHERFSNAFVLPGPEGFRGGTTLPHNPTAPRNSLAEMDPPDWNPLRRAMNPWFSVEAMERFAPRIRAIVNECIDRFIERGQCDLVFDLCNPVPAIVTLDYLGLPTNEWEQWAVPMHTSAYTPRDPAHPEFAKLIESFAWIHEQIRETIVDRKRSPRPGEFISELFRDEGEGPLMDDELAFETIYTLVAAGVDTTTSLLSSALFHLSQNEDDRQRLIADPGLLETACEEFLRYWGPTQATARTVAADEVEVCGERLERGDRVLLAWASANRDGSRFADPDRFIIDRPNNRHVAFAHGIHRCLGAPLARKEFVVAIGEVLRRLPDFQVDVENSPTYPDVGLVFGFQTMPATFTPGRREIAAG
jgi:cytochrome P450